jgi:hypothetical protein
MSSDHREGKPQPRQMPGGGAIKRRDLLMSGSSLVAASALAATGLTRAARSQQQPLPVPAPPGRRPNILVIFGDDIGQTNLSAYSFGVMGYRTPNIDRLAREGMMFTDYYAEQSCTAGRSSFITGQATLRTGLSKVGLPAANLGLRAEDITIAEALKPLGYATGQFGKNHLGDRNEFLPTVHGFDEFFGNLYHLNAVEHRLEGLGLLPFRVLRGESLDAIECELELVVDRLLDPQRAVVVEGGDALGRRHIVRPALVRHAGDEIGD